MATTIQPHNQPIQLTLFDLEQLETRIKAGLRTFIDVPTLSRVCGVQV